MRPEVVLHWTARVWGIASALLLLAFAFGGREHFRFTAAEAVGLLLFPVGVIVGFAVAWRRELVGGLVTISSLILVAVRPRRFVARNSLLPPVCRPGIPPRRERPDRSASG